MPITKTDPAVSAYLEAITDESRRQDCSTLIDLMRTAAKAPPKMWNASIVGFGDFHYRYESGREGDTFLVGFASRKPDITLYLCSSLTQLEASLKRLGKHKAGKGCLYLRRLDDVDLSVLGSLLLDAVSINATMAAPPS